jgi:hypothetical protein
MPRKGRKILGFGVNIASRYNVVTMFVKSTISG